MAKNFGKLVFFSALTGAIAAGTYYYLQKKNDPESSSIDNDEFDDDFDDDFDDTFSHSTNNTSKNRPYVSLDIDNAKEIIGEKVIETLDKTKEKIIEFNVPEKLEKAKEFVEEVTSGNQEYTRDPADPTAYTTVSTSSFDASDDDLDDDFDDIDKDVDSEEFFDDTEE